MKKLALVLVCLAVSTVLASPAVPQTVRSLSIPDLRPLSVGEVGELDPWAGVAAGRIRPTALAKGDFDRDGVPDLVVGYAGETRGFVTLHRGNVDALFPNSPGARERRARGLLEEQPFLTPASVFEIPVAPDFLGAGDFDNDGKLDLAIGTRQSKSLRLLSGDGRGGLQPSGTRELAGKLTALAVGEINRRDGLPDLMLGLRGKDRFAVAVFEGPEGAWHSEPESLAVPAEVTALLPARLAGGTWIDLAVAAGDELVIVRGRDRKLLSGTDRVDVPPPLVERFGMPDRIESLAWGDFAPDATASRELALLLGDGTVRLLSGRGDPIGERGVLAAQGGNRSSVLLTVRLSGMPTDELAILDARESRLVVVSGTEREDTGAEIAKAGAAVSSALSGPAVAILPMRFTPDALTDLVILQEGVAEPGIIEMRTLATITVDTDLDVATSGDGLCSLREAINNSNFDADTTGGDCVAGSGVDTIAFNIDGGGTSATITLASGLPLIASSATIDGTTQACASPPCVALDGGSAGILFSALQLTAGSNTVRGLAIQRMQGDAGEVDGLGIHIESSHNFIEGVYIGTDFSGTVVVGNEGAGIRIDEGTNNVIGGTVPAARNLLSGGGLGVNILGGALVSDNVVVGNFAGTDVTGTIALGSTSSGISIKGANTTVGGTDEGAGNVFAGAGGNGVHHTSSASGTLVQGNHIGVDVHGTTILGNGTNHPGVWINGTNHTVGGTSVAARNVISGNPAAGVYITTDSTGNHVLGNYVGTDVSGTLPLGNGGNGIALSGALNCTVGGTSAGAGNLSSGNGSYGVWIGNGANGNQVLGNFLGTDVTGTVSIGNTYAGARIYTDAYDNDIGGPSPGAGNLISGNRQDGIDIWGASNNRIRGNLIGTDVTGTLALGNGVDGAYGDGVYLNEGSGNVVGGTGPGEGNVVSGNKHNGFYVDTLAHDNQIVGNLVGTDVTGTLPLGNGRHGIFIVYGASNNTVGGTSHETRNVISANSQDGVALIGDTTTGNRILGNFIGTDVTGTHAMGNDWNGVELVDTPSNTIGGSEAGAGNVISASLTYNGIQMSNVTGVVAQGNFIGTDVTGTVPLGNVGVGIRVVQSTGVTIGGPAAGEGNLIAGNALYGVDLDETSDSTVAGNTIGLQVDGMTPMGNQLHGVLVRNGGGSNEIGGSGVTPGRCDGPCNRIGFVSDPDADGICVESGTYNTILGNSVHSCGGLGIDLANDGITPNDVTDPDIGANNLQNYPELTLAEATPGGLTMSGTLNSRPNLQFRLEFYSSPSCDDSGYGEGATYLGYHNVTTDGSGEAAFTTPALAGVSNGHAITATATSVIFASFRDTSEFSACASAACLSIAEFGQTVLAADRTILEWPTPDDVWFVKGPLAGVGSYDLLKAGDLLESTALDISVDEAPPGDGFYYLIRSLACGSWQTGAGEQPQRDALLP